MSAERKPATVNAVRYAYAVTYRRDYGRDKGEWVERLFATHAAAKQFAARKMAEPGWRVRGWPRKVKVLVYAISEAGAASHG